jgi:hypothetical protein
MAKKKRGALQVRLGLSVQLLPKWRNQLRGHRVAKVKKDAKSKISPRA